MNTNDRNNANNYKEITLIKNVLCNKMINIFYNNENKYEKNWHDAAPKPIINITIL